MKKREMSLAQCMLPEAVLLVDASTRSCNYHSLTAIELCSTLDCSLTGLSTVQAHSRFQLGGGNIYPSPSPCPKWMCCLLPALKRTPAMLALKTCLAEDAVVFRSDKRLRLDSEAIVPGDLITIKDQVVPADARILIVNGVVKQQAFISNVNWNCNNRISDSLYLESTNMLWSGCYIQGEVTAIVVATGEATVMSALLRSPYWPPTIFDLDETLPSQVEDEERGLLAIGV